MIELFILYALQQGMIHGSLPQVISKSGGQHVG